MRTKQIVIPIISLINLTNRLLKQAFPLNIPETELMRLATDAHLMEQYFLRLKLTKTSNTISNNNNNNNNNSPILVFLMCGVNRQSAKHSNSTAYRQK